MPPLDLGGTELPDLNDPDRFPAVGHAPSCIDDNPTDGRTCHPVALVRPRPYAHPTEPLGRLRVPRAHRPGLPPLPPSLGTHCPTIESETEVSVGDAAAVTPQTELRGGDSCRPTLRQVVVFPCTRINPEVQLEFGLPAAASWNPPVNKRDNNQCIQDILLKLKVPGCTIFTTGTNAVQMVADPLQAGIQRTIANTTNGNCGIKITDLIKIPCIVPSVVAGTVTVNGFANGSALTVTPTGDACNRQIQLDLNVIAGGGGGGGPAVPGEFKVGGTPVDPSLSGACVSGFGDGREVPLVDVHGVYEDPGDTLDPGDYEVINDSGQIVTAGDLVSIATDAAQLVGDPIKLFIKRLLS